MSAVLETKPSQDTVGLERLPVDAGPKQGEFIKFTLGTMSERDRARIASRFGGYFGPCSWR